MMFIRRLKYWLTGRYSYGGNNTIHSTGYLDVEVHPSGTIMAVWFRCQPLPFRQHIVGADRSKEMEEMYGLYEGKSHGDNGITIHSIEISHNGRS